MKEVTPNYNSRSTDWYAICAERGWRCITPYRDMRRMVTIETNEGLQIEVRPASVFRGMTPRTLQPSGLAPNGSKWCPTCKCYLPINSFATHKGKKDGRQSRCRMCTANQSPSKTRSQNQRIKRSDAQEYRDKVKAEGKCADCGGKFPKVCYDFDHVRGEKLAPCSRITDLEQLKAEIAKCDLVCSNCHRIRTADRKQCNWGHVL